MIRRLSGLALLLIGLAGVALSVAGLIFSGRAVTAVGGGLDDTLSLVSRSLSTVEDTLGLVRVTISDVNDSMDTVGVTAQNLAGTIEDTRPLVQEVTQIASEDAPDSIASVQATIPQVAEVAGVIDDTLVTLSAFRIDQSVLGVEFKYDLGIDYKPRAPFDEAVTDLGASLDGLPERLRDLEPSLTAADQNLATISQNIEDVTRDLNTINTRIAEVDPLLLQYVDIVREINSAIEQTQTLLRQQLDTIRLALQVGMIWLGLMQFALLYLGWDLLTAKRHEEPAEVEAAVD